MLLTHDNIKAKVDVYEVAVDNIYSKYAETCLESELKVLGDVPPALCCAMVMFCEYLNDIESKQNHIAKKD